MPRNRRHQSAAIRFGPALKAVALCLLIGGSAVGYVWQKDQIRQLGTRITNGEQAVDRLRRQNEKLRWELSALRSSANLERVVQARNLGLVNPHPDRVIRLKEPDPAGDMPGEHTSSRQFAANRDAPRALGR